MNGTGREHRPRLLYLLDLMPTYIAREVQALSDREEGDWDIEIHLPVSSPGTGMWRKILPDDPTGGTTVYRDVRRQWCTIPVAKVLANSFLPCLASFIRHPVRFLRTAVDALRRGSFRHFLIAADLSVNRISSRPDIVHSHFAKDAAGIAMWLSKLTGIPATVTTHANDIFVVPRAERVRDILSSAAGIHTISSFNRDYMGDRFGRDLEDRIFVSRLGIDQSVLPAADPGTGKPVFVCTASGLVPKKGVEVLVEACRLLRRGDPDGFDFRCEIIGSDPSGEKLEAFRREMEEKGLDDCVSFTGLLASDRVLDTVSRCTAFVLPSVEAPDGDMDGIPVALMEAMGMGVPAISTSLSGIPELVENEVTGLAVAPGDPVALAGAMARLVHDPELAGRLGAAGSRKVNSDFSLNRYVAEMDGFWSGVISDRSRVR